MLIRVMHLLVIVAASASGCKPAPADVRAIAITTGGHVGDIVESDSTAVMLYSPRDCFACFGVLSVWQRWSGKMVLVLTDHPTPVEELRLRQYRLGDYRVASQPVSSWPVPSSHLFVNGAWVASGRVLPGRDRMRARSRPSKRSSAFCAP